MVYEMKQTTFRQDELQYPAILETLNTQIQQLEQLKYQLHAEDNEAIKEAAQKLDFDLIRYACSKFGRVLEEATRDDCAQLIASSVTDPGQDQKCRNAWEKWLLAAHCWPKLAQYRWMNCQARAVEIVIEKLEGKDGLSLDSPEGQDIVASVRRLELSDLVAPDVYQRAFAESAAEGEGDAMSQE